MTHPPLRILWGPYNHQIRDRWLQFSLRHMQNTHFGPFGAELIYRPDLGQADLFSRKAATEADLVIVLDPHLRLMGPELLSAPCPLVACSGPYPFDAEQWGLFDGLIPLEWCPDDRIQRSLPVSAPLTDWMPLPSESFRYAKPRIHPLVCLAEHVSSELWQALEQLDIPVLYLNTPDRLVQHRVCSQAQVVLIPDHQPAEWVFEAWHAGVRLLLSAGMAAALEPLLQRDRDFVCFNPAHLSEAYAKALQLPGSALAFPWQHTLPQVLKQMWPELQQRCQQRLQNPPRPELLHGMWAMSPVQYEALRPLNAPWLKAALEPSSPLPPEVPPTPTAQLAAARYLIHQGEQERAQALLTPLLNQPVDSDVGAFPVPALAAQCQDREAIWRLAVCEAWLETQPLDFSDLLKAPPLPQLKTSLSKRLSGDLTPILNPSALAHWLLQHWPADPTLRAAALRLLPESALLASAEAALSLYTRSPGIRQKRVELLGNLLENAPIVATERPLVVWEGPFSSYSSFARVNLGLFQGLSQHNDLEQLIADQALPEIAGTMPSLEMPRPWRRPQILIHQDLPYREQPPAWGGKWVMIMPWEYGLVPRQRVPLMTQALDEVWVPSQFCVDAYHRSGVPAERLKLIPNGVDTAFYTPEGAVYPLQTRKSFRILYVGGTLQRKGFDLLLNAYLQAFGPDDDVCLVVKDYGGRGQYQGDANFQRLYAEAAKPTNAEILILADDHLSDEALVSVFRACQLYVQPYRAEGFGMPILEAMACGLPVVIPDAGPAPEFCPAEASWRIPTVAHFLPRIHQEEQSLLTNNTTLPTFFFEPQVQVLAEILRTAQQDPERCAAKGRAGREAALAYDWQNIAEMARTRLHQLAQTPLSRRERQQQAAEAHLKHSTLSPKEALPLLERATELDGETGLYWLSLARCHAEQQNGPAAAKALQQGFANGLSLAQTRNEPVFARLWQTPKVWKHPACELPLPSSGTELIQTETPEDADFTLSPVALPSGRARAIFWLGKPDLRPLQGAQVHEVWTSEGAWAKPLLQKGLPPERLVELPLTLDFQRFHPFVLPQYRSPAQYGLLSITHWQQGHWKYLLQALTQLTGLRHPLHVTLVPLGVTPEQAQADYAPWQAQLSGVSLKCHALSTKASALQQLYTQQSCFVDTDPRASGQWHLLAQAMGVPSLSAGQRSFLRRPYSEICTHPADAHELAWRISERLKNQASIFDGLAIREHLIAHHDTSAVQAQISARLGQQLLLQQVGRLR